MRGAIHLEEEAQSLPHELTHPLRSGHRHGHRRRPPHAQRACAWHGLCGRGTTCVWRGGLLLQLPGEVSRGLRRVTVEIDEAAVERLRSVVVPRDDDVLRREGRCAQQLADIGEQVRARARVGARVRVRVTW